MVDRDIGLEPDRFLAVDQGFLGLTAVEENQAEPTASRGVSRCQLDGATQVFQRFVVLSQFPQRHREIPVSLSQTGPQLQGTPEVLDRFTRTSTSGVPWSC